MIFVLATSSAIAIVVSFLCSMAEVLLLSFNPLALSRLNASRPRAAESWKRLKSNISRPITAILVLNTVAHTGGATVGGGAFAELYGEHNIWMFSITFTIVVLFGTEILPKIIGVAFRNQLAPFAGPILEWITIALYPVIVLSETIFRGLATHGEPEQITTSDLVTLASLARSGKSIDLDQENIIVNAVRLGHSPIMGAMIPLEKVRFLSIDASLESLHSLIGESGHTRYPISRSKEAKDIHAYIVAKKLVPSTDVEFSKLIARAKPIRTVDSKATLMTGLHLMLQSKEHLLAVVDRQRNCIGIVTLEDIAGELLSADINEFK